MGISMVEKIENKEFSPKEIREMLGIDNAQIQELCKMADIKLKKNHRGLTYFTQDDAKTLKDFSSKRKMQYVTPAPSKNVVFKGTNSISSASIVQLVDTLRNIEKSMTDRITAVLDEKLDGMDDVVMDKNALPNTVVIKDLKGDVVSVRGEKKSESNPLYLTKSANGVIKKVDNLESISPNDIKTMNVFKGEQGEQFKKYGNTSNGVILIELK